MEIDEDVPQWLTAQQVIRFHAELIDRFGGTGDLRDRALLESALARPKHKARFEQNPTLPELAAAYGYGLVKNHPFHDGNKRTGATAIAVFLYLNDVHFEANEAELATIIERLADGRISESELATWIRQQL